MLHSVQRLLSRLSRYSDASEMALVGMVPVRGDRTRPLLVFHTYLREGGVADVRGLLESGDLATLVDGEIIVEGPDVDTFTPGGAAPWFPWQSLQAGAARPPLDINRRPWTLSR